MGYVNGDRSHGFVLVSFGLEIDDWLNVLWQLVVEYSLTDSLYYCLLFKRE